MAFFMACTSDDIIKKERAEFYEIYKNLAKKRFSEPPKNKPPVGIKKTSRWLSKFKQPIILISSIDHKNQATLVALGNNEEKLTWVSADGISLTFDHGVLIATRGYSQDLLSLKYKNPKNMFLSNKLAYTKIHRYLNSENRYKDIVFQCKGKKILAKTIQILDYTLPVDSFIEECKSEKHSYKNEYALLAGTTIVIISKQWISPLNGYFQTYNMYSFQKT